LTYLGEHHEFPGARKETKSKLRVVSPTVSGELLGGNLPGSPGNPVIPMPVFTSGEADSISRFQQPSSLGHTFRMPGNLNSSVFGLPMQNSSSRAFQELFGANNSNRNRTEHVVINSPPPTTPVKQFNRNPPGGAPGPGDSDGDDSGDEGGNKSLH